MNTITAKQRAFYIHAALVVLRSVKDLSLEDQAEAIFEKVIAEAMQNERDIWEKLLFVRDDDKSH